MTEANRPTLLVFTLGPGRERARKRWLGDQLSDLERELHERCLERVLEAGRGAGCRLRVSTPVGTRVALDAERDRQAESSFGGRLLGAMRRAAAESSGPLIVVGTDTPGLDAELLRRTRRELARDPAAVVLGPATDGGIYLVAATRPVGPELATVRWCCKHTRESLVAALEDAGRPVRLLPPLEDLDSRRDLERWLAVERISRNGWSDLVAALRAALRSLAAVSSSAAISVPEPAWCRRPSGRAPPH